MFTQIPVGDQRWQQHGKWQRRGSSHNTKIKKKLSDQVPIQSFSNDVIKVADHLNVQQYEHHHQEGDDKWTDEGV